MLYLVHFDKPLAHARHYRGFVDDEAGLDKRMARHKAGTGARILSVLNTLGIGWKLVATFPGDRKAERRMKSKATLTICSTCQEEFRAMHPLSAEMQVELDMIRETAKVKHEKKRRAAKKRGRHDFPLLPFECSWAYEEKFRRSLENIPENRLTSAQPPLELEV